MALNHVILYLPEFDLYDDPTANFAAFAALAAENYDKPVVQNVGSDNAARIQLQALNSPGSSRFDLGNATETSDPVVGEGSFALNQKFNTPAQGARAVIPVGMALTVR